MSMAFRGTISVDIRDSSPTGRRSSRRRRPTGRPTWSTSCSTTWASRRMSCYGGPIETPNIDRIAAEGIRYTQWHTTALCSPTRSCLLTGRNHTRNSMACITEAAVGFPNASGTIPPENGMLSEILGERGWNTYMVGKWHLCPTIEMNVASTRRNWPSGPGVRALVRIPGCQDEPVVPGLGPRQPSGRPAQVARGGLPPHRGHHRQGAGVHQGCQGCRTRQAILPVLRTRCLPRPPPRPEGVDREVRWAVRRRLRGHPRTTLARQKQMGVVPADTELPPVNPIGTPETRKNPKG